MIEMNEFSRLLLREARKEYQLILGRCNDFGGKLSSGFEYVIQRPPQARICFGSSIERETVPLQGPAMSALMYRRQPELLGENLAPGCHNIGYDSGTPEAHPALRKRVSRKGFGPLAATSVRFNFEEVSNSPGVGDYELMARKQTKQSAKPFGSGTDERTKDHSLAYPGVLKYPSVVPPLNNLLFLLPFAQSVGTYIFKTRKDIRNHSFGGTIKIVPAARTICKTENFDRCQRCDERPEVDYWKNLRTERCLCRRCMAKELEEARSQSKNNSEHMKRTEILKEYKLFKTSQFEHSSRLLTQ
uniref:Uncharacterized protein n=1 Tax=Anopheles culicifacies TaxID=139723 RepID=A0A182M3J9_9DIPT